MSRILTCQRPVSAKSTFPEALLFRVKAMQKKRMTKPQEVLETVTVISLTQVCSYAGFDMSEMSLNVGIFAVRLLNWFCETVLKMSGRC